MLAVTVELSPRTNQRNQGDNVTDRITVYSMDNCPACIAAKRLLEQRGVAHDVLMAGEDFTAQELAARVGSAVRTLPQIFSGERYVGTLVDLQRLLGAQG